MYKVSVVIPIYNVEKYIARCARALFKQTLDAIEYIFVNDCTPDRSMQILQSVIQEYPNRSKDVIIINHEHNRWIAAARNSGRDAATGSFIIFCDSDDWPEKDMYELLYDSVIEHQADIAICDWNEVYADKIERTFTPHIQSSKKCMEYVLTGRMHGSLCNKLIRRSLYTEYRIACKEGVNYCEDLYVIYKLLFYAKSITYVDVALYNYFKENENSYTTAKLSIQSQQGLVELIKDINLFIYQNRIIDRYITDAVCFIKVSTKAKILYYGSDVYAQLIPNVNLKYVVQHPTLPIHYKAIVYFSILHFNMGVKFLRNFLWFLKSYQAKL